MKIKKNIDSINTYFRKGIKVFIIVSFVANVTGSCPKISYAEESYLGSLPTPGEFVNVSSDFLPASLRGLKVYPKNPFQFDFFLEKGDKKFSSEELKDESEKLVKYFLASLTIPEKDMWVNLSPYEEARIIPDKFSYTEMGRDLLAQDYVLKELTASLMYPENDLGSEFWDKIYAEAYAQYGTVDIPMDTFNKVWIVPAKAVVYENEETESVFVLESKLKVMMEEDYIALSKARHDGLNESVPQGKESSDVSHLTAEIVKNIIIPVLEKEVNEGKHFAKLRQIYNAMILATWFKRNLKGNLINQIYADQNKVEGIDITDKDVKEKIYQYYLTAFKKGIFNYVKDEYDPVSQNIIPRKYFSGGVQLQFNLDDNAMTVIKDKSKATALLQAALFTITIGLLNSNDIYAAIPPTDQSQDKTIFTQTEAVNPYLNEAIRRLQSKHYDLDLNSVYDELRRMEPGAIIAPEASQVPARLVDTPEKFSEPLSSLLKKVLAQAKGKNAEIYRQALELIRTNLETRKDLPLGDLGYLLREMDTEEDSRAKGVLTTFEGLSNIYTYNQFDETRPTVLLMHGAGRGTFNSFDKEIEKLKDRANIIYYQYDFLDPLDENTERFYTHLKQFQKNHRLVQPFLVLAYSNGSTTFRNAVLNYDDSLWAQTHLVRIAEPLAGTRKSLMMAMLPGVELGTKIFSGKYYHLTMAHSVVGDAQKFLTSSESDIHFREALASITTITAKDDPHALPFDEPSINPFLNAAYERARRAFGVSYGFKKITPQEFDAMPIGNTLKTYIEVDTKSDNPHSVIAQDPQTVGIVEEVFTHMDLLAREKSKIEYKEEVFNKVNESQGAMDDGAMVASANKIGINQKFEKLKQLNAYEAQQEFLELLSEASEKGQPKNVLFVCLGNLYRSRIMHQLFEQMLKDKGIKDVTVSSGGTFHWDYRQSRFYSADVLSLFLKSIGATDIEDLHGTLDELMINAFMNGDIRPLDVEAPQKSDTPLTGKIIFEFMKEFNQVGDLAALFAKVPFKNEGLKARYLEIIEKWQKGIKDFNAKLNAIPMYQINTDKVSRVLQRLGVDSDIASVFVPNIVTKDMVENATVIVTTDQATEISLKRGFNTADQKTFLFNDIAPKAFKDDTKVPDPGRDEISVRNLADKIKQGFQEEIFPNVELALSGEKGDLTLNDILLDLQKAGYASLKDLVRKTVAANQYIHRGEDYKAYSVPGAEQYILMESRFNKYLPVWGSVQFVNSKLYRRNVAVPLITIGNYQLLRYFKGTTNGVKWQDRQKRNKETETDYLNSLQYSSEQMTQEAYDEFADNLNAIYAEGYKFDLVNPNNILLDKNHFNLVDIGVNYDEQRKPSVSQMVEPLLDVYYIDRFIGLGKEDALFNARARQLRRGVLQKVLKSAIKYNLDLPEDDDKIMTLAFSQAGMKGKWPEYRQRVQTAINAKNQKSEDDYAMATKDAENFIPKSLFKTEQEYAFVRKLINKATRDTRGVPLNYYMQEAMSRPGDDSRILRTIDISLTDIVKGVFPPFNVNKPHLYEDIDDVAEFDVVMAEHDIFLASTSHNGLNAKIARLGFAEKDKRAVAVITFLVPNRKTVLDTFNALTIINAAGFGPLVHGMHYEEDEEGEIERVGIVTDIATGDFIDKTGDRITKETYYQFRTLHSILKSWGYVYGSDFQYFVTQSGNIEVIDPICIFEKEDQYYKHLAQLLLSMKEELAVEIIADMMTNEPEEVKAMYAYMDQAAEKSEPMSIGSWREIAALMQKVGNSLKNKGGIDLNANNLEIESRGGKIHFELPNTFLKNEFTNIQGFTPIIINISPTMNMPLLLGINPSKPEDALFYSVANL